eukprot:scaffold41374_cov153-Skeletonema_marinoi.AAC.2
MDSSCHRSERKDYLHRDYPRTKLTSEPDYAQKTKCEDCRMTPIEQVKTVHCAACQKTWECRLAHPRVPRLRDKRQADRDCNT